MREYQPRNYRRGICKACRLIAYIYMESRCWDCFQAVLRDRKRLWHQKHALEISRRRAKYKNCKRCGQKRKVDRKRVCSFCTADPAAFPLNVTGRRAETGDQDMYFEAPYPAQPTAFLPGSPEKVAAMAERALRREKLFHPEDARDPELPFFALGREKATGPRRLGGVRS